MLYNHSIVDSRILATVRFHVAYAADLGEVTRTLGQVAAQSKALLPGAAPPTVAVAEAGPSTIRVEVSGWTENQAQAWAFQGDVRERGLDALASVAKAFPAPAAPPQNS